MSFQGQFGYDPLKFTEKGGVTRVTPLVTPLYANNIFVCHTTKNPRTLM